MQLIFKLKFPRGGNVTKFFGLNVTKRLKSPQFVKNFV